MLFSFGANHIDPGGQDTFVLQQAAVLSEQPPHLLSFRLDCRVLVWDLFSTIYQTWHLMGEERQVHTGENFVDPPDLALGAFKALAWLKNASAQDLAARTDLPFCRADLDYVTKLAIAMEESSAFRSVTDFCHFRCKSALDNVRKLPRVGIVNRLRG